VVKLEHGCGLLRCPPSSRTRSFVGTKRLKFSRPLPIKQPDASRGFLQILAGLFLSPHRAQAFTALCLRRAKVSSARRTLFRGESAWVNQR
jgi:hypothetical protein